jgi:mono/diheme cytochrome c family protein
MSSGLKGYIVGGALLSVATLGWSDSMAQAPSLQDGKGLYEQNCLSCHTSSVFTRPDHKIRTPAALEAQVAQCAAGPAKVKWDAAQIKAVADYLAKTYYKF